MIIFDGKAFAHRLEEQLTQTSHRLQKEEIIPKLAIFYIGENEASEKYIKLKQQVGARIGVEVDLYKVGNTKSPQQVLQLIKFLDSDPEIHGLMIQLPLPKSKQEYKEKLFNAISPFKDVDGHRQDSEFESATVKAILKILVEAKVNKQKNILIVGSRGEVGSRLSLALKKHHYQISEYDNKDYRGEALKAQMLAQMTASADVLVTATGVPHLITGDLVKKGVTIIDVGSPESEVDFQTVKTKASFITPVPGGVGPVTVISLLENVVQAASRTNRT